MPTVPFSLCALAELLEDASQHYELAAKTSDGLLRERRHELMHGYAAMLAEIRHWESCAGQRDAVSGFDAINHGSAHADAGPDDGYDALMDRVCRMHRALASLRRTKPHGAGCDDRPRWREEGGASGVRHLGSEVRPGARLLPSLTDACRVPH